MTSEIYGLMLSNEQDAWRRKEAEWHNKNTQLAEELAKEQAQRLNGELELAVLKEKLTVCQQRSLRIENMLARAMRVVAVLNTAHQAVVNDLLRDAPFRKVWRAWSDHLADNADLIMDLGPRSPNALPQASGNSTGRGP